MPGRPLSVHLQIISKGKSFPYVEIKQDDNLPLKLEDTRSFLAGLGLSGTSFLHTPGHSDYSMTFKILDEGYAFR